MRPCLSEGAVREARHRLLLERAVGEARRRLLLALCCTLLGACAVAPETPKPAKPAPALPVPQVPIVRGGSVPPPPVPVPEPPPAPVVEPRGPIPIVIAPPSLAVPPPPMPVTPPITEEEQQALGLLAELQRLVVATPDDVKRELAATTQAVARSRGDAAKVKLAMLLTLPANGAPDDAKALALLEQVIGRAPAATPTRQLAALLHAAITERQREVREEQKKTEAIQQKLDALKSVEKDLLGRDRRPTAPPRTPPAK